MAHKFRARRPERVTERDRATVHVDLGEVDAEFLLPGEHDRREGLVDLDEVDVVEREAGRLEDLRSSPGSVRSAS